MSTDNLFWDKLAERYAKQPIANLASYERKLDVTKSRLSPTDGICAYSILHLVEDRADTLQRIFAYLKPGGFFISSTVCLGESFVPYQPILAVMRWLGKAPPVRIFSAGALLHDIREAGFIDISTPDVGAKKIVAFVAATRPR